MVFSKWIDTFIEEKNINIDHEIEVDGSWGINYIPIACIIEGMKATCKEEQRKIKDILVKIDFKNGDVLHFFNHLAKAMAV